MNGSPPSPRAFSLFVLRGVGPLCFPLEGRGFGAGRGSSGGSLRIPSQPADAPVPARLPGSTGELPRSAGAEPALPPGRASLGGGGEYCYLTVPPLTQKILLPAVPLRPPCTGYLRVSREKSDGQADRRFCWRIFILSGRGGARLGWSRLEAAGERVRGTSGTARSRGKSAGRGRRVAVPGEGWLT